MMITKDTSASTKGRTKDASNTHKAEPLTPLQQLISLAFAAKLKLYRNTPSEYIPKPKYTDRTANALTKCIIDFIRLSGGQSERISNTGRILDSRKKVTDCLGRTRQIGSVEFIPGTGTNGTSDIAATIQGRSVKIEVKIGKDRQSDAQQQYQQSVEAAGGIYIIASSFAHFYEQYQSFFK